MKVENQIKIYEIDDKNTNQADSDKCLIVKSHWNYTDRIVVVFEGKEITVIASHLRKAIENACNH